MCVCVCVYVYDSNTTHDLFTHCTDNTMQVLLKQLELKRSGHFITPKMLHLILNYLKQAYVVCMYGISVCLSVRLSFHPSVYLLSTVNQYAIIIYRVDHAASWKLLKPNFQVLCGL